MRRYIGFREFVQRDQRSLVGTGLLLTGSHEQAIRLTLQALRTVGTAWPPAAWESPGEHAHIALYRAFLRRPSAAGATALVQLPPRRRLIVVACLHHGRSPAELADILGLPVETVESELAEGVETLTKGDRKRLVNRFAMQAGEASVPDLSTRSLATLRRRGRRRALLTAVVLVLMVGLIIALTPQGQAWIPALAAGEGGPQASAMTRETAASAPGPSAAPTPWQAPRTSYVIHHAVPGECAGARPATPWAGKVLCSGWKMTLISNHPPEEQSDLAGVTCEPLPCRTTLNVPDAVQELGRSGTRSWELGVAVSRDGRRVAYLSAAELRYVAHDLPAGTKRYLSPALTSDDIEHGPSVDVSPDGRSFTVDLASGRLRTDFTTGATATLSAAEQTPAEKAEDWLRDEYPFWASSPTGKYAAATVPGEAKSDTLHIVDAASRRVFKRLSLPALGEPVTGDVVDWLNAREVVVMLTGQTSRDLLGFYRIDAVNGQAHRVPGLPADKRVVIGTVTAP
ncbi:hypothetical protein GCM10010156_45740 [Planobispora rosea]|uniref:RNA polymerase sigma factor 70 region 4 type 2 domain-containing protein n=1 Tax=Planobispora rosea TaxID=35762 RepID=A0A8J3S2X5_PLARO|nr:sigma factor-like helix-turn-helix DNA-binding protein [Planobispora rosea]GGS81862.1 hypothetical protein GCM10010156_45740 [Planobispora rosea]GIH86093.1 hypothetical protein Pro02_45010 [Planobispora rosea]